MTKAQLASDKVTNENDRRRNRFNPSIADSPWRTIRRFNDSGASSGFFPVAHSCQTSNTLTELTRLKVFYVLLVFGLLLIGSSIFMAQFSFQQEFQILKDVSLGAISMFTSL